MNIDPRAMPVINALNDAGGSPWIVGGFVRDLVMGEEPKDIDIEVYGLTVSDIGYALRDFKCKTVGARFGVFDVHTNGLDLQIVPPRRENKVAPGHKGFVVEFDPSHHHARGRQKTRLHHEFNGPRPVHWVYLRSVRRAGAHSSSAHWFTPASTSSRIQTGFCAASSSPDATH